ncbi:MAG: GNAT family N-acetyltransferase [Planctomycetes bacterium]|nr:GNAT family N-acetyltransferase [Planctomycetota bacterium]
MATVQNKPFTLKTGERGIIRSATEADAAALLVYARENLREGTGSVTTLEEFTLSIEDERKFLTEHAEKPGWLALLAEVNGKVVGFTGFRNNPRKRLAHNGMLGISVAREFRGRGVGEALLSALLEWARANPLIDKVSLAVFADNAPAIALYRKLGFKEEGRRVREIKFGEGQYKDDLLMAVWVK